MTSRRPPRRDPRAEDGQAPASDDLGARRGRALPRVPAPPTQGDLDGPELEARLLEADIKRRRAEALSDGLAHRVASLEAELRRLRAAAEAAETGSAALLASARSQLEEAAARSTAQAARIEALEVTLAQVRAEAARSATRAREELEAQRDEAAQGARPMQEATISSARDVLARLERHESKVSALRKEALARAITLLDEARLLHVQERPVGVTPAVPISRPALAAVGVTAHSAETSPGMLRADARQTLAFDRRPSEPSLGSAPTVPLPARGSASNARVRGTMQGLAAIPKGAFHDKVRVPAQAPRSETTEDAELEIRIEDDD